MWNEAEAKLREVLNELNVDYFEAVGEAAFYGPKLDVEVKPAVGPEVTLSTCQLDFLLQEDLIFLTLIIREKRKLLLFFIEQYLEHLTGLQHF